ncbi:MAG: RNA polymerase sigma factor region1.1 domain-containing protein, partial [Candidatus Eremiobacteraeota bacterium]|nr:RNA polymerase sigma factor region1.1 domain-containing protein [Candidatus Eremiobacteraeota bacterium]
MARKKTAATSNGAAAPLEPAAATVEELKKRVVERGKKRGSVTLDEINVEVGRLAESREDLNEAEIFEDLMTELNAAGVEVLEEAEEEKPDEDEAREETFSAGL